MGTAVAEPLKSGPHPAWSQKHRCAEPGHARQQVEHLRARQGGSPQHHARESNTGFNACTDGSLSLGAGQRKRKKEKVTRTGRARANGRRTTPKEKQGSESSATDTQKLSTVAREAIAKRECQRARDQKTGQEALATKIAPPGCDALDSNSNNWILWLDVGSLQSDDAGVKALINSGAALPACPSQFGDDSVRRATPGAAPFRAPTGAIIKGYGDRTGQFDHHGVVAICISRLKLQSCRGPSSQ